MKISQLIKIFAFPIIVLALHIFLIPLEIYYFYPWFDIPMHFLGGLAVAVSYSKIIELLKKSNKLKTTKLVSFIFVVSLVALTAIFWEFFEFSIEKLLPINVQVSLEDTLADLLFGLIGGACGYFVRK